MFCGSDVACSCPLNLHGGSTQQSSLQLCLTDHWSGSLSQQEDEAPPRPPLPELYSPEDQPPAVPPLPREATIIRHTSVRGLKRQSDERKRDRELGQCVNGDSRVSGEPWDCHSACGEREGGMTLAGHITWVSAHRWSCGRMSVSLSWRPSAGTWPSPPWDLWALRAGTRRCQAEVRQGPPWSFSGNPTTLLPAFRWCLVPFCLQLQA